MALTTHLYARLTYRYNAAWSGQDNWVPLTPVRSTLPQLVRQDEDGNTLQHSEFTFTPGAWVCARWLHRRYAREQAFTHWLASQISENCVQQCRCEHDCCGHMQQSASARYLGKRRFSVELHRTRNV